MMLKRTSQSQSKVREEPGFEQACLDLDSIKLWAYTRKSHLTHIFGEDDEMSVANIHDQALRYHNLRQGDKEYISDFKIRFDHQVKSNQAVGIPEIGEPLRAMDFIGKHDIKRYNGMLTRMRNCACQNLQVHRQSNTMRRRIGLLFSQRAVRLFTAFAGRKSTAVRVSSTCVT